MTDKKPILEKNKEDFDVSGKKSKLTQNSKKNKREIENIQLSKNVLFPVWLSVSESAKLGGVTTKTIRRALQNQKLTYKIVKNRYQIDFRSIVQYLYTKKKLKNKLLQFGIGQYIDKWRE